MCALAEGNLIPGASSQLEAGSPNYAGRYDGRGVDHGSPAELSCATRLSRPARPVSDQCHFVALLYTLSRDTTHDRVSGLYQLPALADTIEERAKSLNLGASWNTS